MTAKEFENEIFDEDQDPTAELEMLPSGFLERGADYVELETEAKTTGLEEQVGSPSGTGAEHESTRHRDSSTRNIESIQRELDTLRVEAATLATRVRSGETRIERHGQSYTIYSLEWKGYNIWGATAAMLMNLIARIKTVDEQEHPGIRSSAE